MNNEQQVDTANGALVYLDNARHEIESASDILSLKNTHDKLSAMNVYFKAAKASFDITQRCSELKIRCERRAGELLGNMDLNEGGRPSKTGDIVSPVSLVSPPKLADLDISKKQSSRWQQISKIPPIIFEERLEEIKKREQELTSTEFLSLAGFLNREQQREKRRESANEEAKKVEFDDRIQIRHGDFQEVLKDIPDNSVDLILTDPIYAKENFSDWSTLSLFASRVLKKGKLVVCYSFTNILSESIKRLSEHLEYVWTLSVIFPTSRKPYHKYHINGWWKPILLFSNGPYQPCLLYTSDAADE